MGNTIMSKEYTLKEVNYKLKELFDNPSEWFCPKINDLCKKDCVCYIESRPIKIGNDAYKIRRPQCDFIEIFVGD